MKQKKLPAKLGKPTVFEAIFEVRGQPIAPLHDILPGVFFSPERPSLIERLPAAQIPDVIRNADPTLKYIPLIRISGDSYSLMIGKENVSISCTTYAGWSKFKKHILEVFGQLEKKKLITKVDRYSLKYVNLLEGENVATLLSSVDLDLKIGSWKIKDQNIQLRAELIYEGFNNAIQIISSAAVQLSEKPKKGLVIDIDSIMDVNAIDYTQFYNELGKRLDHIHHINKTLFFDCLTDKTIAELEPVYE